MFVELRVHGVSGTPPVDMLDHPLVKQVAGDTDGRFFRPVDAAGNEVRAADGHVIEGYHWGPLTSGTWRQALWLVLIPFGLVNAAYFMLPAGGGNGARVVARGALRVLALVLTAVVTLGVAEALVDLLAWQWPATPDPRWWLAGGFVATTGALLVVRFLGGPPRALPDSGAWTPPAGVTETTGLAGGQFYTGDRDLLAVRHLHVSAGLTVLSVLAAAVAKAFGGPGFLYWLAVGLLGWTVVHVALLGDPRRVRTVVPRLFATVLPTVALCASGVLLALSVGAMSLRDNLPANRPRGVLPGVADLGMWATGLAFVALVVLACATAVLAARTRRPEVPRPFRRYAGGMVGPVVAALGMFLAVGFTAALDYGVLRLLRPAADQNAMTLPLFYLRIAYAAGIAVALAAAIALVVFVVLALSAKRFSFAVRDSATKEALPDGQVSGVARAWWVARLKFVAHWFAIALAAAGTLLTTAAVVEAVDDLVRANGHAADVVACRPTGWWLDPLSDCRDLPGPDWVSVGTAALLLLGAGLVYLGRRAVGDSAVRRGACVVWDVVAFWPAAVHPFVPPPYSPKVIEDLRRRIARHLGCCYELAPGPTCTCQFPDRPASFVVLAGHSQGSTIAAAALTRLTPACRSRVALLTFGSQLQIAYARAFPAYVNHRYLCWLQGEVLGGRWLSLYRETDPIGGPVLSWDRTDDRVDGEFRSRRLGGDGNLERDEVDSSTGIRRCGAEWRLLDPEPSDGLSTARQAMRRHSSYSLDPAWRSALATLTAPYRRSASTASAARRPDTSAP
jgi:hypothetical protein